MPSSRQKSCLGCVRSKRRCDQGFPKCRRCIARRIDCEYTGKIPAHQHQGSGGNGNPGVELAEPLAEDSVSRSLELYQSPATAVDLTPYINGAFLELGGDVFNFAHLQNNGIPDLSPAVIEGPVAQQDLSTPGYFTGGGVYQSRVEFAAGRLAGIPKTFVERTQTMFIHRRMFQDKEPPVLQDALSACALYCLKNRENQTLVLRNVEQKAQQLVASTDTLLLSTAELLFSVQALLLYQIIRLFDGDIRQRAQAEADEATLMAWTVHLKAHMQQVVPSLPPSAGALSPVQVTAPDWHRWLVKESIRRTVFTAFTLKGVYDYLKYGSDEESGRIHRLCYTAQAALWDAQSEHGWRTAYCEQERLELRMESFNEDIAKATPGDLEELSLIVLAIYWGVETVEEWLGKHHAARHGLEV